MTYEEMIEEDETFIEECKHVSYLIMDTMYIPDVEYMNIDGISRVFINISTTNKRVMENENIH